MAINHHREDIMNETEDKRVLVSPCTSPPYKWICSLKIEDEWSQTHFGTGFKIYLPDIEYTVILTAGHNIITCKDTSQPRPRAMVKKITVKFPGEDTTHTALPAEFFVQDSFKQTEKDEDDYGFIFLTGKSEDGFGWAADLKGSELKGRIVNNCGYPFDKNRGKPAVEDFNMWITGGEITKVEDALLHYRNDTTGGESGGPVYTWYNGYWTVVGIHTFGCVTYNKGRRLTLHLMASIMHKVQSKKTLKSVATGGYLSCNSDGDMSRHYARGRGEVSCKKVERPSESEQFYIYPLRHVPSLATQPPRCQVVIESAKWKNVFIRLHNGGKKVNMQFGADDWEKFYCNAEQGDRVYSIQSAACDNGCRIDVNHSDGKVKCYTGSNDEEASKIDSVKFEIEPVKFEMGDPERESEQET